MVVWGGLTGDSVKANRHCLGGIDNGDELCQRLGDGGRYDPASDAWRALGGTNPLVARAGHFMAWTGKRVLIIGGSTYTSVGGQQRYMPLDDGALYDPETQTFTSIAPPGAAQGISTFQGILVGSRVVFTSLASPDVWVFDPDANTWQSTPATDGWSCDGLTESTGRLTGLCKKSQQRAAGLFDAQTATWTMYPLPPNVPEAPTVFWNGTWLFIWGGYRLGPTPPNPCLGSGPQDGQAPFGCDPPGPQPIPSNEGWMLRP
jgi:hypothetical protein